MMYETAGNSVLSAHEGADVAGPVAEGVSGHERSLMTIHFPRGLPAFPNSRDYELASPHGGTGGAVGPFLMLRGCEQDAPSFVTVVVERPAGLFGAAEIDGATSMLDCSGRDLLVLLMVGRDHEEKLHVNMRAPIFIDVASRAGAQLVLSSPRYPLRAPLQVSP